MRYIAWSGCLGVTLGLTLAGCGGNPADNLDAESAGGPARYLYIWMGDKDGQSPDFLAVVDVREGSKTFGTVLSTVPVNQMGSMPHHVEYQLPPTGQLLFANAHHTEANLLIDFSKAAHPRVVKTIRPPPPLRYPHDFVRLPNGHVLVGYLSSDGPSPVPGDMDMPGNHGGIAEFDQHGTFIRLASAAVPGAPQPIRPYAFAFFSHWLAKDPGSNRLILGQEMGHEDRMLMLRADPASGELSWDEDLRADDGSLGISFVRKSWPHGDTGEAIGHAAVFRL